MCNGENTDGVCLCGLDPEEGIWVPGVDYVSAWRVAEEAASAVNAAAERCGVDGRLVNAVPHVGARGEAVVWLRPESARLVAMALVRASGVDQLPTDKGAA